MRMALAQPLAVSAVALDLQLPLSSAVIGLSSPRAQPDAQDRPGADSHVHTAPAPTV